MTYPSASEEDYEDWEYPEHECVFVTDNRAQCGIYQDGKTWIYEVQYCKYCYATNARKTDREATPPGW